MGMQGDVRPQACRLCQLTGATWYHLGHAFNAAVLSYLLFPCSASLLIVDKEHGLCPAGLPNLPSLPYRYLVGLTVDMPLRALVQANGMQNVAPESGGSGRV